MEEKRSAVAGEELEARRAEAQIEEVVCKERNNDQLTGNCTGEGEEWDGRGACEGEDAFKEVVREWTINDMHEK